MRPFTRPRAGRRGDMGARWNRQRLEGESMAILLGTLNERKMGLGDLSCARRGYAHELKGTTDPLVSFEGGASKVKDE